MDYSFGNSSPEKCPASNSDTAMPSPVVDVTSFGLTGFFSSTTTTGYLTLSWGGAGVIAIAYGEAL